MTNQEKKCPCGRVYPQYDSLYDGHHCECGFVILPRITKNPPYGVKIMKKKTKTMFAVGALVQNKEIKAGNVRTTIPMIWHEGMIGCLPVFDNEKDAQEYSEGKYPILKMEMGQ
jgi:hypothetical protein